MNAVQVRRWRQLANDLGIEVTAPFRLAFSDGAELVANALIRQFGGAQGLVADEDSGVLVPFFNRLTQQGYGFSCVGIDAADDYRSSNSTLEMLADWTWVGPLESRPRRLMDR
jgi:hypothetical protein